MTRLHWRDSGWLRKVWETPTGAEANTTEQKRTQSLPIISEEFNWLRHTFLAMRYPNACNADVPARGYTDSDAKHTIKLVKDAVPWAELKTCKYKGSFKGYFEVSWGILEATRPINTLLYNFLYNILYTLFHCVNR